MSKDNGYEFKAVTGERYRVIDFRIPEVDELQVDFESGSNALLEGMAGVFKNTFTGEGKQPAIIVTPVEPTYEVTVRLSGDKFDYLKAGSPEQPNPMNFGPWLGNNAISDAIERGNYREVTD